MTPYRVVLDCNVVISALLLKGRISSVVGSWKSGAFRLLACKEMLEEWARVMAYPRFGLSEEDIHYLIETEIVRFIEPIAIENIPDLVKEDPSDNVYLACAAQGNADFLVSGDAHLLALRSFRSAAIITPSRFLELLRERTDHQAQ